MSKGSRPRPFSISQEELGNRIDSIFGKKTRTQYVPPPLPDMTVEKKEVNWGSPTDTENKDSSQGD
jgi:hypothetical protein